MGDLVTNIEKYKKGWVGGLPETPCGYGSLISQTYKQRVWIPEIVKKYKIKSIADIGAGDLNWMKKINLEGVDYTPYDLIPRSNEVKKFNLIEEIPPKVDLIICLWVLNHFPKEDIIVSISNIKASGSKYLMVTDRIRYREDQPKELNELFEGAESLCLNEKNDSIRLVKLK